MDESDEYLVVGGRVKNITLNLATSKEIRFLSPNDCPITHPSQLMNPFLGLPVESGKCESCGTSEPGKCEGHFGFIELPIPIYHPNHVSELKNILNMICLKCLKLKKGKGKFVTGPGGKPTDNTSCSHCKNLPPLIVREVKDTDGAISLELKVPLRARKKLESGGLWLWSFLKKYGFQYGKNFSRPLLACEALEVLKRIPEDIKRKLSGEGHYPQYGYIMQSLPVPPNCLLVPDISDGKTILSNDISISLLRKILSKIDLIKKSRSGPPTFESYEIESSDLQVAIAQYLQQRGAKRTPQDVTRKLATTVVSNPSAKHWLEKMRSLFISKGSSFTSRSVLTGDPYKGTQEIGIPSEIAKKMTFEERVTEWNIKYLQELVDNRQCLRYGDGSSMYSTEEGSKGHTSLKIGQVVSRKIIDGDCVFVNRPPTTHKHALQAFSVYVHDDHTIKINPLICAPFGADFDGDCVHVFYPQSLAAKAEVRELFSVEKQLCSSHSGTLNIQFVNDALLALKLICRTSFLKKSTIHQLLMFTTCSIPPPSVIKANGSGPLWTVLQILQTALPCLINCLTEKILIRNGEILKLEFSKDSLHLLLSEIAMLILRGKGPSEALNFFNALQPLLMEILCLEGFSISLADFYIPKDVLEEARKDLQETSCLLGNLIKNISKQLSDTSKNHELIDIEVDNCIKRSKVPIKDFIVKTSLLGNLIDVKSDSSISKLIQQLGFIGPQLFTRGKLYSKMLVDEIFSLHVKNFASIDVDHPSEVYGLIRSSFFDGLNPYEELIHSISTREVIIRSSRGLAEPGTLFKNLMAVLRDVAICYDGTVRNMCSNSIVQFEYGAASNFTLPGEPVGVLAATSISKPAYAAVLDSSQSTNLSWELMKEILLSKVGFKKDTKSRKVVLFLEDCCCGKLFCREIASLVVQSYLKKVTLKECAINFSIRYESDFVLDDGSAMNPCLVGHILLDKGFLSRQKCTTTEILQKCEDALSQYKKKKKQVYHIFKGVSFSASNNCNCIQASDERSQLPCLRFSYNDKDMSGSIVNLDENIWIMANRIYPILLDVVVKGDPRVNLVNITWLNPSSTAWIKKSQRDLDGEVALEVVIEEDAVNKNTNAWNIVLDACLPVAHLIDLKRSVPYGIQQIQALLGISAAFDLSVKRLSAAVGSVAKGVLKEHLMLISHNMTCTGNFIGFNAAGYRTLFRSFNVQVPFTEATLLKPMKCFERAAEMCHTDSLSSIVASSLWGKNVSAGTGAHFEIIWNDGSQESKESTIGNDVYEFLHMVMPTTDQGKKTIGEDVDELIEEDDIPSPEHDTCFEILTFDDADILSQNLGTDVFISDSKSSWEKVTSADDDDGWGLKEDLSRSSCRNQNKDSQWANISGGSSSWEKETESIENENVQHENSWDRFKFFNQAKDTANGWDKVPSSDFACDKWPLHDDSSRRPSEIQNQPIPWTKVPEESSRQNKSTTGGEALNEDWSESSSKAQNQNDKWAKPTEPTGNMLPNENVQHGKSHCERPITDSHGLHKSEVWEKVPSSISTYDEWGSKENWARISCRNQNQDSQWAITSGGRSSCGNTTIKDRSEELEHEKHSWQKTPPLNPHGPIKNDQPNGSDHTRDWGQQGRTEMHLRDKHVSIVASDRNHDHGKPSTFIKRQEDRERLESKDAAVSPTANSSWEKTVSVNYNVDTKHLSAPINVASEEKDLGCKVQSGSWGREDAKLTNEDSDVNVEKSVWDKSKHPSSNKECHWDGSGTDKVNPSNHKRGFGQFDSGFSDSVASKPGNEKSQDWGNKHLGNRDSQSDQNSNQNSWDQTTFRNEKQEWKKWRSDGWKKQASVDKSTANNPRGMKPPTPRREPWSAEENNIRSNVEPIVQKIKLIRTSYNDGEKLSEDDEKYILQVFEHHPNRSTKLSGEIDHVKVDQHNDFPGSRCFFIVASDGSTTDFSYIKCIKNFVRKTYEGGDAFCDKFFKKKHPGERPLSQELQSIPKESIPNEIDENPQTSNTPN